MGCTTCTNMAKFYHYIHDGDDITAYGPFFPKGTLILNTIPKPREADLVAQKEDLPSEMLKVLQGPLDNKPEKPDDWSLRNSLWWHTEYQFMNFKMEKPFCYPKRRDVE